MKQNWILSGLILLVLITSFSTIVNADLEATGVVSWITDGDTFDINYVTYRMADIDAPEFDEDYEAYEASKYYLLDLIHGKTVYLDIDDWFIYDNYGTGNRIVCVVYVNHNSTHYLNVNMAMVFANHAEIRNYDNEFDPNTWSLYVLKPTNPTPLPTITPSPTFSPNPTVSPTVTPTPTITPTITPTPSYPTPTPTQEAEFPTITVLASVVILSIVGLGILVYLKKYKRRT